MESHQIDAAYNLLISKISLDAKHREMLLERGFTDEEIAKNGYKSYPRSRIQLVKEISEDLDVTGVPGFYREDGGKWQLAGASGLMIPIRNREGQIASLKIRSDNKNVTAANKYTLLSSNPAVAPRTGECKFPRGAKATPTVHFPLGCPEKVSVLRITEGEIKADIAWSLTDEYTVSLPGVSYWKMAIEVCKQLAPEKVLLSFDSDKHREDASYDASLSDTGEVKEGEKYDVAKCLSRLYMALKAEGFDVLIEDWDAEFGKGIDDVLVGGNADKIRLLSGPDGDAFAQKFMEGEMQLGWNYIVGIKKFIHGKTYQELDKEQFRDKFSPDCKGNADQEALKNPAFPRCDYPIYLPGQTQILSKDKITYFNLWKKNEIEMVEGDAGPFLDHVGVLFPDPLERKTVLDFMAFNIQRPGEKIMWALVIQGDQGTGKSYLGDVMGRILGEYNISLPSNDSLHENYTAWQTHCSLVIVEELMAAGRLELMNKLKPMITQKVAVIREMWKAPYTQPNTFNFLCFTNHDDSLLLDEKDRRYCVIHSPASPKGEEYFDKLWGWTADNIGIVYNYLFKRDLSSFNPHSRAPMTEGKQELIRNSMNPVEAWITEGIEEETWPFNRDLICANHLLEVVPTRLRNFKTSSKAVAQALKKVGAICLGQVPMSSGSRPRIWAIRRQTIWQDQDLDIIRKTYETTPINSEPGSEDFNPLKEDRAM